MRKTKKISRSIERKERRKNKISMGGAAVDISY
jgi:hypothetical protein